VVLNNLEAAKRSNLPITVLIATHGRGEDQFDLTELVQGTYKKVNELETQAENSEKKGRELIVVTLVSDFETSIYSQADLDILSGSKKPWREESG
jgi:hypothetical protein